MAVPVAPVHNHVVLASADSQAFASLRRRPTARSDRYRMGKALRKQVPRRTLAEWTPPTDRADPVQLINESHEGRLDWLIPLRVGRMTATPYGFLRGTAVVMAEDVAGLPATGITPVICGDSHLGNFGFYASPERDLVIDLNDFDEAHPGGWEWDLRRLVASIWVAGRQNGATEEDCSSAVVQCVAAYRTEVRELSDMPLLARSYQRVDVDKLHDTTSHQSLREEIRRAARQARTRTSDRALPRFTRKRNGRRQIVEEPPLITRVSAEDAEMLAQALDEYLATLAPHWRRALGGYTLVDIAHKVVGVGSVGLRAYVALLEGSSPDDVVFLQLKQATAVGAGASTCTASRPGTLTRVSGWWSTSRRCRPSAIRCWGGPAPMDVQYYVRQFRNMKGSVALDSIDGSALADYAGIVGHLLAKGHARTSGASMIAGYMGGSDKVDVALAGFARLYADQTEADHAALVKAAQRGEVPVERES